MKKERMCTRNLKRIFLFCIQVVHLCWYSLLARWVLQDDGSQILEIVGCSGIEGHHKDTRSSWVNENSSLTQRNHELYNKGKFVAVYFTYTSIVKMYSNFIVHE